MSAEPSVRQLTADVALHASKVDAISAQLDAINAQLDTIVKRLDKLQDGMKLAVNAGGTGDGLTLTGNITLIRGILEREFGPLS